MSPDSADSDLEGRRAASARQPDAQSMLASAAEVRWRGQERHLRDGEGGHGGLAGRRSTQQGVLEMQPREGVQGAPLALDGGQAAQAQQVPAALSGLQACSHCLHPVQRSVSA